MAALKGSLGFLNGGGEMGKLTREFDWSTTALGLPAAWPSALQHAVSNMLQTRFPMLVLWGKEFTCFYNDAFLPSLGEDGHPALGKPAKDVWSEGWEFIGAQLNKVFETAEAVTFEDQPVVIHRDGVTRDIFWTFCYSPVLGDDGKPSGVLVTCMETTTRQNRVYETVISATPDLVYVFDLKYRFSYANKALLTMWGKTWDTAIGRGLRENGYEEWHAAMHEREIDQVAATGKSVRGEVAFPHAILGRRVYDYILVPVFNEQGKVEAVAGTTRDISDIKQAELAIRESEERFRNLVIQAPVAIAVFRGEQLVCEIANDAYLKFVDKKPDEFVNVPLFESLPEVRQFIEPIIQSVMQTGENFYATDFEVIINRYGSAQTAYFNFTYSPLRGERGNIEGFFVVVNDVTSQVIARRKVEESEAALANAVELAELGTWRIDGASRQVTLSLRHAAMWGVNELSLTFEHALSVLVDSERDRVSRLFDEAMCPGSSGIFNTEYRVSNIITGGIQILHAIGQAYFDKAGNFTYMEGTAQDVTAQVELQLALENEVQSRTEELQATNEELATTNEELSESTHLLTRSNEELSQFAYVASHDLQEPVRKISVFVEMLEKSAPEMDERSKTYLGKIDESANRMLTMIRDILTHSQIARKGSQFVSVDLNKTLANALSEFEVLIEENKCEIKSDPLPTIDAIEVQMSQLFSNLISNALKFATVGIPLCLEIKSETLRDTDKRHYSGLQPGKTYYRISFIDNGIGFDQSYASQIFEIFQRLHTKTEYSGTGIGLATCKKIVQNHGGDIEALSSKGHGAQFDVVLPGSQD